VEGFREMERGVVERQAVNGGPEVEHVAVGAAVSVEALEDVPAEVGGEGALRVVGLTVDGTTTAALQSAAAQVMVQSQVLEDLRHRDLLSEEVEEPETKLTADEAVTNDRAGYEHQRFMGRWIFFFARFELSELVEPGQGSFDEPARFAQTTPVGCATFSEHWSYPLFLSSLRCGSESYARSP
jgi:hypothetical protein